MQKNRSHRSILIPWLSGLMIAVVLATPVRIRPANPRDHLSTRHPKPIRHDKAALKTTHNWRGPVEKAIRHIKKSSGALPISALKHAGRGHPNQLDTPPSLNKPEAPKSYDLLLAVVINGYATGKIGEFTLNDGKLWAHPQDLRDLGFRFPSPISPKPDGRIALSTLSGLTWHIDQATQTLYITVPAKWLSPLILKEQSGSATLPPVQSGLGATINYDLTGTSISGVKTGAGQLGFRAFSPWGVLSSGFLAYLGASPQETGGNSWVRLDSTYTYDDTKSLIQYRLGDFINGGLNSTRPVRLGGIQISSDFSMRPDLITYPLPIVAGSVAVPSTVNVLVNGTQFLSQQVSLGPFQIPHIPITTGAGTIVTTITNALGQQVTTTLPFYGSTQLLAPGLQSFSASLGFVRLNWGILSQDYGDLAASGSYRRGLTNRLTLEAHAEGTRHLAMMGGGAVFNVDNLGIVDFFAAGSSSRQVTGREFSIGAQRSGRVISMGASAAFASANFRDIAALNGEAVPTRQINANLGFSLGHFGSLGINYAGIDSNAASTPIPIYLQPGSLTPNGTTASGETYYFQPAEHVHLLSVSYSDQTGPVSFFASAFQDLENSSNTGFSVGVTIPFGSRGSLSANTSIKGGPSRYSSTQLQASQTPETIGQWGYRAYADTGPGHNQQTFGQVQYMAPWGLWSAGIQQSNRQTLEQGEVQGALSYLDGGWFPSNRINDSFAVVDTHGFGHIRVFDEHRLIGRTGNNGLLLVPDLIAFNSNLISIDPNDAPLNATIPYTQREIRPQYHSGVVVRFPIHSSFGGLLKILVRSGKALPVGSVAILHKTGAQAPIGYDGETYLVGLSRQNRLLVKMPNGRRCTASFAYHPEPGVIPTIGPVICRELHP